MLPTSLEESLQVVNNLAEGETTRLLIETAGKKIKPDNSETTVYRPYFVIGLQLWLSADNNIIKGEGAEFGQNTETSSRYFKMQRAIDLQNELVVPAQYTCDAMFTMMGIDIGNNQIGFLVV